MEAASRAVMVKLPRLPAVIIDRATPLTTVVDAHVELAKSNVWADERDIHPNTISRDARPDTDCKMDGRFISRAVRHRERNGQSGFCCSHQQ
jgi:hypothetical protein